MDHHFCLFPLVLFCGNILTFRNREVQRELQLWDLKFDTNFVSFSGRILKEVRIFQGRRAVRQLQNGHVLVTLAVIWGQMNNNAEELSQVSNSLLSLLGLFVLSLGESEQVFN